VWSASGSLDLAKVRKGAAAHLAAFKVPERMWLAPSQLPRGRTGKIDKALIRRLATGTEPDLSV
jgi:long-chain acyl-CoA synthetase